MASHVCQELATDDDLEIFELQLLRHHRFAWL